MTTETTPMQDLSTCFDGRIKVTNERVFGIARGCLGNPLNDGYNSSRALKRSILLTSTHFIKFWRFKR